MAVVALTRTLCKAFHHSGRTAARCYTGNRRRRTVPATEPNREAVEIALPCTCATEIRAAGEVPSIRGAPAGRPVRSRFVGADRYVAHVSRGRRCRPDEGCRQCTAGGRVPPAPSTSSETC